MLFVPYTHPLTSVQIFTEIVSEKPFVRVKCNRVDKDSDVGHVKGYISETVQSTASGTTND